MLRRRGSRFLVLCLNSLSITSCSDRSIRLVVMDWRRGYPRRCPPYFFSDVMRVSLFCHDSNVPLVAPPHWPEGRLLSRWRSPIGLRRRRLRPPSCDVTAESQGIKEGHGTDAYTGKRVQGTSVPPPLIFPPPSFLMQRRTFPSRLQHF